MKFLIYATALCAAIAGSSAYAADYPDRTVTIVVPFPAGGGTDSLARILAQNLQDSLGETFIVENRPGAGSLIGVDYVAKSDPDGYTLLLASSSALTNVVLGDKAPYDMVADFAPIRQLITSPAVLVANPAFPADNLAAFLDAVKAEPGKYLYASYGDGSQAHLAALLLQAQEGFEIRHIPYNGGSSAITATISGETNMVFPSVTPAVGPIKNGQLKGIAIASNVRSSALPELPTFAEQGVDFELGTWFGLMAPAGTPDDIVAKLDSAVEDALNDEAVRTEFMKSGAIVEDRDAAEFQDFIVEETDRWTNVRNSGLLD